MGSRLVGVRWGLALGLVLFLASPVLAAPGPFYLSLGTSLSVGIQPDATGENQLTNTGYADQLHQLLRLKQRRLQHVKLGCPSETTTTMILGGSLFCPYPLGSQLAQAVDFLRTNRGAVSLVTLDMGANDLLPCAGAAGIDPVCIFNAFVDVQTNLPFILSELRSAAGPGVPIVAMNYYNPFVAAWLQGPPGEEFARQSALLLGQFNDLLEAIYAGFAVPVGDVARAFHADDFDTVPVLGLPLNVLLVCQWTWMCAPPPQGPNVHGNRTGYFVIALTLAAALHQETGRGD